MVGGGGEDKVKNDDRRQLLKSTKKLQL